MENTLDLTATSDNQKLAAIAASFQKLNAGEQVFIKSNGDFASTMSEFQNQFWGKYDWQPFLVSADVWSGYLTASPAGPTSILQIMEGHHKYIDTAYVKAENTLMEGDAQTGMERMRSFLWNMELHFNREEKVLFPTFEERTGMTGGPTAVMRTEHQQIRGVLKEVAESLDSGDYQRVYDLSETMLILIQQHNSKEENILYPMTDQHLADEAEQIARKLQLFTF